MSLKLASYKSTGVPLCNKWQNHVLPNFPLCPTAYSHLWVLSKPSCSRYSYSDYIVNELMLLPQTDDKSDAVKQQGFWGLKPAVPTSTLVTSLHSVTSTTLVPEAHQHIFTSVEVVLKMTELIRVWIRVPDLKKTVHESYPDWCTFLTLCTRTRVFSFPEWTK